MTANAVASLSLDPPLMIVCFALTSRTLAAVEHSRRFGVQFLAHDQEEIAARFASKLPEQEKFDGRRLARARRRAGARRLPRLARLRAATSSTPAATT